MAATLERRSPAHRAVSIHQRQLTALDTERDHAWTRFGSHDAVREPSVYDAAMELLLNRRGVTDRTVFTSLRHALRCNPAYRASFLECPDGAKR